MNLNYSKSYIIRNILALIIFQLAFNSLLSATQIIYPNQLLNQVKNFQTSTTQNDQNDGLEVSFNCNSEQVNFCIWNPTGLNIGEFKLSIIEDDVILFIQKYTLNPRDSIKLSFPNHGSVYKVKIEFLDNASSSTPIIKTFNSCIENNLNSIKRKVNYDLQQNYVEIESVSNNIQNQFKSEEAIKLSKFNIDRIQATGNELTVLASSLEDDIKVFWSVFDLNGNIINHGKAGLNSGENILNIKLSDIRIGFYVLLIQSNIEYNKTIFKIVN